MLPAIGSNKIRQIVRFRQMLQRWRRKAALKKSISPGYVPPDVPNGHVALYVGTSCRRFIVRATHLNHPMLRELLIRAEEEYGFANQGPLTIPCDESLFEEIVRLLSRSESRNSARFVNIEDFKRRCHVGFRSKVNLLAQTAPLLHEFAGKSIC